jgi:hypothetical protein
MVLDYFKVHLPPRDLLQRLLLRQLSLWAVLVKSDQQLQLPPQPVLEWLQLHHLLPGPVLVDHLQFLQMPRWDLLERTILHLLLERTALERLPMPHLPCQPAMEQRQHAVRVPAWVPVERTALHPAMPTGTSQRWWTLPVPRRTVPRQQLLQRQADLSPGAGLEQQHLHAHLLPPRQVLEWSSVHQHRLELSCWYLLRRIPVREHHYYLSHRNALEREQLRD